MNAFLKGSAVQKTKLFQYASRLFNSLSVYHLHGAQINELTKEDISKIIFWACDYQCKIDDALCEKVLSFVKEKYKHKQEIGHLSYGDICEIVKSFQ